LGNDCRWEGSNYENYQSKPLVVPQFLSNDQMSAHRFLFMSLGYQLCHFDVTLGFETTNFCIFSTLLENFKGRRKVEAAQKKNIDAHEEANIDIYGNNYNQQVVTQMAVLGNKVEYRPPVHTFVDQEGLCEPCVLVFVN
jgi:hypothetical protein